MIRRPPRSTLFPTRRSSDLKCASQRQGQCLPIDEPRPDLTNRPYRRCAPLCYLGDCVRITGHPEVIPLLRDALSGTDLLALVSSNVSSLDTESNSPDDRLPCRWPA